MSEIKFAYKGEAQLVRWADSLSAGRTLTLRLEEEGLLHPFKGIPAGQRMQVVAVLVDDQEQPLAPERAKRPVKNAPGSSNGRTPDFDSGNGGSSPSPGSKPKLRSNLAALRCEDVDFQAWLKLRYYRSWKDIPLCDDKPHATATAVLKAALGIQSRTELDDPPGAPIGPKAEAFDRLMTDYAYRNTVRQ